MYQQKIFFSARVFELSQQQVMLRSFFRSGVRQLSHSSPLSTASTVPTSATATAANGGKLSELSLMKFDSNGSKDLYAICKIHNMPYLVTKGDRIILPYKIKGHRTGDILKLNNVVTIGSRNFTLNDKNGISDSVFSLTATLAEITREPKYYVYKRKPRCRRVKTVEVEPYQTHLLINELKLT